MTPFNLAQYNAIKDPEQKIKYETEEINRIKKELTKDIKDAYIPKRRKLSVISSFLEDMNVSYLYCILTGIYQFSLPPYQLVLFCYYIYQKTSCHEVLSGLEGITMLPKKLSGLTEMFLALPVAQQHDIINFMEQYIDDNLLTLMKETPRNIVIEDLINPGSWPRKELYRVNHTKLVKQRLLEAANDRVLRPFALFGLPCTWRDRKSIMGYFDSEESADIGQPTFSSRYSTLLHYALQLNTSVDQFYVIDYTEKTKVKLFDSDSIVNNKNAKKFISRYLYIQYDSEDAENIISARVMSMYYRLI